MTSATATRSAAAVYLMAAATAVPMLCLLWVAPVVPATGAPEELATVAILRGLLAGREPFITHFELNALPAPWLQVGFLATFWEVVGPIAAQKLLLSLCLLGLPLAAAFLRRGLEPSPPARAGLVAALLASLLGPSWCFFMGLFDFLVALPLMLVALGVFVRYLHNPTRRRALGLLAVFPLVGLAEPAVLAATGLIAGIVALAHRHRLRALAALAGLGAAGWALLAAVLVHAWPHFHAGAGPSALRLPMAERLGGLASYAVGGPTPLATLLAAPLLIALGLSLWAGRRFDTARRPAALGLLIAVFTLALAYVLAPFRHPTWSFVQPRLALGAFLLVACLGGLDWRRASRVVVAAVAVAASLVVAVPLAQSYLATARDAARIATAASAVPRGSLALPVIFEPESNWADPWLQPLARAGGYLTVFADAITPYHDADQPLTDPVLYRRGGRGLPDHPPLYAGALDACLADELIEDCFERRRWLHDLIVFQLRHFDAVFLWRPPPELIRRLAGPGYLLLGTGDGALIVAPRVGSVVLQFRGAPVELPLVIEVASVDGELALTSAVLPARSSNVTLGPLVDGRYRVRVWADRNDDGRLDAGDDLALGGVAPGAYAVRVYPGLTSAMDIVWPFVTAGE